MPQIAQNHPKTVDNSVDKLDNLTGFTCLHNVDFLSNYEENCNNFEQIKS